MTGAFVLMLACVPSVDIEFRQVAPVERAAKFERGAERTRAAILVQGLRPRPFSSKNAAAALPHGWQVPDAYLVRELQKDHDVYSLSYGQNAPIEAIAADPKLQAGLKKIKLLGYEEIVMVAHSAGGVLARIFIEDHPDCGVTRLVQTSAPNAGSGWAGANWFVRKNQEPFLHSLTKEGREKHLAERADKKFPANVEFVCLVGRLDFELELRTSRRLLKERWLQACVVKEFRGDGVVACQSQWPPDLQAQGIPACVAALDHYSLVRSEKGAKAIARVVRSKHPRWSQQEIRKSRTRILGMKGKEGVQLLYHNGKPDNDGVRFRLSSP